MPSYTFQMLYVGQFADMDPIESNSEAENVAPVLGGANLWLCRVAAFLAKHGSDA